MAKLSGFAAAAVVVITIHIAQRTHWDRRDPRAVQIGSSTKTAARLLLSPSPSPQPSSPPSSPSPAAVCKGCLVSQAHIMGALGYGGTFQKTRYKFEDVFLESDETLRVYLPIPLLPTSNYTFDIMRTNVPKPLLPTRLEYRHHKPEGSWRMDVQYLKPAFPPPKCKRWEERPVYIMHLRHGQNIWHVLNGAVMGAFQTLREERLLPLAAIDAAGNVQEYTEDFVDKRCLPEMMKIGSLGTSRPPLCRSIGGQVKKKKCTIGKGWCTEGLVAVNRSSGPIIVMTRGSQEINPAWRHLFHAVSKNIRKWDDVNMEGTCFRELYVGKSNTLNFYINLYYAEDGWIKKQAERVRNAALDAFQQLIYTAQRAHAEKQRREAGKKWEQWPGYHNSNLERLRQGIDAEDVAALETLRKLQRGAVRSSVATNQMTKVEAVELLKVLQLSQTGLQAVIKSRSQSTQHIVLRSGAWVNSTSSRRPVVTFMWREGIRRSLLNAADLLEYILLRYDVMVRVTTFEEPLLETMQLMLETDILLGMHGQGWTNALFMKSSPHCGAMQLFPYGWMRAGSDIPIRGGSYKAISLAKNCTYMHWASQRPENAYFKRTDFDNTEEGTMEVTLHPSPELPLPEPRNKNPGAVWIYQNTVAAIEDLASVIDEFMAGVGVQAN